MSMFRYVVQCNKNGQVLYLANDATFEMTTQKANAQQFLIREVAIALANSIMENKKLCVKKAKAEKIAPGREVSYVNC